MWRKDIFEKRIAKRYVLLFLLVVQSGTAQVAPEENKETKATNTSEKEPHLKGLLLGVHGARETMFEIGYFNYKLIENRGKNDQGSGYSISTEHYINDNYIVAPKLAI
ncbi:hypothetical protein [Kordia jejudonensis]|uniref:hypothetical protein n=1 Tax=Kordia jejudonensis TaxID=1348245 RepID=UPI0012E09E27|nr:hypothetical protein [Kordia jejudonensis]